MYLLVDGDYFLSGFKPDSEAAVKAAVDRLHTAIEEQLLRQHEGSAESDVPALYGTHIDIRVALFSTALLNSLPERQRGAVISVLRRMRFQCTVLESVRGRLGSPVDAALCTRAITYAMMPSTLGSPAATTAATATTNGDIHYGRLSPAAVRPTFCFVTPNAYIASALELLTTRGCAVVFAVYDGDEVAEELLGYISASYGPMPGQQQKKNNTTATHDADGLGGIAHMPKSEGVMFIPNTEAASAALAALQQEGKDLPLEMLTEIKKLRDSLTQSSTSRARTAAGAKEGSGDKEGMVLDGGRTNNIQNNNKVEVQPPASALANAQPVKDGEEGKPALNDDLSSIAARRRMQVEAELITPPPLLPAASKENSPKVDNQLGTVPQSEPQLPTTATAEPPSVQASVTQGEQQQQPPVAQSATSQVKPSAPDTNNSKSNNDILAGLLSELVVEPKGPTSTLTHTKFIPTPDQPQQPQPQPQQQPQQQQQPQIQVVPQTPTMLPADWEERIDPRTGRKFYVNHRTRQTTWTLPATPQPHPHQQPVAPTVTAATDALPPFWEQRIDPRTGKTFYVNHRTRETTWTRPTTQQPQQQQVQQPKVAWPWEARVDPGTGRTYYINHQTRKTSWTLPSQ